MPMAAKSHSNVVRAARSVAPRVAKIAPPSELQSKLTVLSRNAESISTRSLA